MNYVHSLNEDIDELELYVESNLFEIEFYNEGKILDTLKKVTDVFANVKNAANKTFEKLRKKIKEHKNFNKKVNFDEVVTMKYEIRKFNWNEKEEELFPQFENIKTNVKTQLTYMNYAMAVDSLLRMIKGAGIEMDLKIFVDANEKKMRKSKSNEDAQIYKKKIERATRALVKIKNISKTYGAFMDKYVGKVKKMD